MMNVNVDVGMATQVGVQTLALTWVLRKWVLTKMDATMLACVGGALTTIAAILMSTAPVGVSVAVASGVVGTALAGLTYDKVACPLLGRAWAWLQSIAPRKGGAKDGAK